jgi:hypothetical protein
MQAMHMIETDGMLVRLVGVQDKACGPCLAAMHRVSSFHHPRACAARRSRSLSRSADVTETSQRNRAASSAASRRAASAVAAAAWIGRDNVTAK